MAQIVVTARPPSRPATYRTTRHPAMPTQKEDSGPPQPPRKRRRFGAVAMNFSEDPNTASNGGDMGFVAESALQQRPGSLRRHQQAEARTDSLTLCRSTTAPPGHTVIGYAIYKLISREPAGQRELNDPRVQQTIHQRLHDSHAQLLENAYFEDAPGRGQGTQLPSPSESSSRARTRARQPP